MRVIGVLDLLNGRTVHARGGDRTRYAAVQQVAGAPIPRGNAEALARGYIDRLRVDELYVADLDAIVGAPPQEDAVRALAGVGPVWLDCGVSSVAAARRSTDLGIVRVIVGLETLSSLEALAAICDSVGGDRVAFSLDLRQGRPIAHAGAVPAGAPPHVIASLAAAAGAGAIIVIDLARVGTGNGPDLDTICRTREAVPGLTLVAGGGVAGPDDLVRLAAAGCDAALVASALHDGRVTAQDVADAQRLQPIGSR